MGGKIAIILFFSSSCTYTLYGCYIRLNIRPRIEGLRHLGNTSMSCLNLHTPVYIRIRLLRSPLHPVWKGMHQSYSFHCLLHSTIYALCRFQRSLFRNGRRKSAIRPKKPQGYWVSALQALLFPESMKQ